MSTSPRTTVPNRGVGKPPTIGPDVHVIRAQRSLRDAFKVLDEFIRWGEHGHPEWATDTPRELQSALDLIAGADLALRQGRAL